MVVAPEVGPKAPRAVVGEGGTSWVPDPSVVVVPVAALPSADALAGGKPPPTA
ncbi:MAG: hypothetical protein ACYDH6_19810 [Acidimicrobiales bacterium]